MSAPLTRADLDATRCDDCGRPDSDLVLNGTCHPDAPVRVAYVRSRGALYLSCAWCGAVVGSVAVAPGGAA